MKNRSQKQPQTVAITVRQDTNQQKEKKKSDKNESTVNTERNEKYFKY